MLPRIRFHDLRYSAATLLLGLGIHPKIVSELLGHSQVGITLDLYSHVTATMQQDAVRAFEGCLAVSWAVKKGYSRPERQLRARSSVGQSSGLIIRRSQVRGLPGPPRKRSST